MARSFCEITDCTRDELFEIFDLCAKMKKGEVAPKPLEGKAAACIFTKPSLRTRVSFEVGIGELGGNSLYITDKEISIGKRESVHDVAKVLSRYVGLIMIRTFNHGDVTGLAKYSEVPVINGLTDLTHPCQIMGDYFTIMEHKKKDKYSIAYLGDGNNITNSWLNLASLVSMDLRIATDPSTPPDQGILDKAKKAGLSDIIITDDPDKAVAGADVIYTDVWASMGQKDQLNQKTEVLKKFQVNSDLVAKADKDCLVMHCLPAERGREITDEVMDGPHSVVFDEAENRLHIQKAIMAYMLDKS